MLLTAFCRQVTPRSLNKPERDTWWVTKILRIMQLTAISLLVFSLTLSARTLSQHISFTGKDVKLEKVFNAIKKQTGLFIVYNEAQVSKIDGITINARNMPLVTFLGEVFKDIPFEYAIEGKTIFVRTKKEENTGGGPKFSSIEQASPPRTGIIKDAEGNPIEGASVTIKGTNRGTKTDANGMFSLEANEGETLLISSVGFADRLVQVNAGKSIVEVLERVEDNLREVVINKGYYTEKQRNSVGNPVSIKAKDIERQPVQNPLLALQGRVPGLEITQLSGIAGGSLKVRIQGGVSLANGNIPLYIVDGVPIPQTLPYNNLGSSSLLNPGLQGDGFGNPLNFLNPLDIESIDILKDADATAIYGSRGANGVILITTKRGKVGPVRVTVDVQKGWGKVASKIDMMNTRQYLDMRYEALTNDGIDINKLSPGNPVFDQSMYNSSAYYDLTTWDTTRYTDWQKVLIGNTAKYENVNARINGGTNQLQYTLGATFNRQTTVFPFPTDFADKRASVQLNIFNVSLNQRFRLNFLGNYVFDNNQLPNVDLTALSVQLAPLAPALRNNNGELNWQPHPATGASTFSGNPLASLYAPFVSKTTNLVSALTLSYMLSDKFEMSARVGYNKLGANQYQREFSTGRYPELLAFLPRTATYGDMLVTSWVIEPSLKYHTSFKSGQLEAIVGGSIQQNTSEAQSVFAIGFPSDASLKNISAATNLSPQGASYDSYKYDAIYGRLNYTLLDRYILNLTGRYDGSSKFGPANRFHSFGSVGAAWIFSEERILKGNKLLNFGKLRLSYGTTGNDQINSYSFLSLYGFAYAPIPYLGSTSISPAGLNNPYLEWESARKLTAGTDLSFFNGALNIGASYVQNSCSNQLLLYMLPSFVGRPYITTNIPATFRNRSWEFIIASKNISTGDITWTTSLNVTFPKNKLLKFPSLNTSSYYNQYYVGHSTRVRRLLSFGGVDPQTGLYQVRAKDGQLTSTPNRPDDEYILVNPEPLFYGGLQNNIRYKGFTLDFLFQFSNQKGSGNLLFNNGSSVAPGRFISTLSNQPVTVLNRWQKPGDDVTVMKYTTNAGVRVTNAATSDAGYIDASYCRLKNLSLSWLFPSAWTTKLRITQCKLFIQGQNLLTISNYKLMDPESQSFSAIPPLKIITVGINGSF